MITKSRATIEDLYKEKGKAELVNGELVKMCPTGGIPSRGASKIFVSLSRHEEEHGGGYAFNDNAGFLVNLPNRQSFSPDAAWYVGNVQTMKFLNGAPVFAVEVRSEGDYSPQAERGIADKIRDYFAAGTLVVWDVDLQGTDVITKYTAANPDNPEIFRRGDTANAEPAVPGWTLPVDTLFR